MLQPTKFPLHFQQSTLLAKSASVVFEQLDDFERLGAHMMHSSGMMAGSRMRYEFDEAHGRAEHALVRLRGSVLGFALTIDEEVIERTPPVAKTWQTIGTPRMLVLDAYRMGYILEPQQSAARLTVFIDYALPSRGVTRWLGRLAGAAYARWCVTSMIEDAVRSFGSGDASASARTSYRSAS